MLVVVSQQIGCLAIAQKYQVYCSKERSVGDTKNLDYKIQKFQHILISVEIIGLLQNT